MKKMYAFFVVLALTGLSFLNPVAAQEPASRVVEDGGTTGPLQSHYGNRQQPANSHHSQAERS